MSVSKLSWNPASNPPTGTVQNYLFIAYQFDNQIYVAVGYFGRSRDMLLDSGSEYCIWPNFSLTSESKVIAWIEIEKVLEERESECEISAADRLPPWSNRTVSSMFRYTSRYRMYPFLIYSNEDEGWTWAYWGTKDRKQDRLGSVGPKRCRYPKYRPCFYEARHPYEKVYERADILYWMDPVRMVVSSQELMSQLPSPAVNVDMGTVPYSKDGADNRNRNKQRKNELRIHAEEVAKFHEQRDAAKTEQSNL